MTEPVERIKRQARVGEKDFQTTKPANDQYLEYVKDSQNSIAEKEDNPVRT